MGFDISYIYKIVMIIMNLRGAKSERNSVKDDSPPPSLIVHFPERVRHSCFSTNLEKKVHNSIILCLSSLQFNSRLGIGPEVGKCYLIRYAGDPIRVVASAWINSINYFGDWFNLIEFWGGKNAVFNID